MTLIPVPPPVSSVRGPVIERRKGGAAEAMVRIYLLEEPNGLQFLMSPDGHRRRCCNRVSNP